MEKFLFDTSFEDLRKEAPQPPPPEEAVEAPEPELPPPPPTYSEEEMSAARKESFQAGKQDGLREAQQSTEAATVRVLEAIAGQVTAVLAQRDDCGRQDRALALQVAAAITRKLFPKLANTAGLHEIEQLVSECLERMPKEPRLVIRMADGQLESVRTRLEQLVKTSGFEGRLVFLEDFDLGPGDARVEWADGGAERKCEALWSQIDQILNRGPLQGRQTSDPSDLTGDPAAAQTGTVEGGMTESGMTEGGMAESGMAEGDGAGEKDAALQSQSKVKDLTGVSLPADSKTSPHAGGPTT